MINLNGSREVFNCYGGSERKKTFIYRGERYMVKFPDPIRSKDNSLSYMNNTFSEYLGCKIFKMLGFSTQEVELASYEHKGKMKIAVMCKDFCTEGKRLCEVEKLFLSKIEDVRGNSCSLEFVRDFIDGLPVEDGQKQEIIAKFWEMFVVDTLIGNIDRHLGNWGFLIDEMNNMEFSPIYDCGSSLAALLDDDKMPGIMADETLFKSTEYNISSVYAYGGRRLNYHQFYKLPLVGLRAAVLKIVPHIVIEEIAGLIMSVDVIPLIRRKYLVEAVTLRKKLILDRAYRQYKKTGPR